MHKFTLEDLQKALYFLKQGQQIKDEGNTYFHNGQYQEAIECFSKDLELANEVGYRKAIGVALGNMGSAYQRIGQYQKAMDCHTKSLRIAEEIGDRGGIGRAFGNMGNVYNSIGQHQRAIDCHHRDLEISEQIGNRQGTAAAFGNMGLAYGCIGQLHKAIDCHRKLLEIAQKLGNRREAGMAFGYIGDVYNKIGLYRKAIVCHRKRLEIAKELGDRAGVSRAFGSIGDVFLSSGQYQKAISYLHKSVEIADEIGDMAGVGRAFGGKGFAYLGSEQYQKAVDCLRKSLEIAEEIGDRRGAGLTSGYIGVAYWAMDQYHKAVDCLRNHLEIAKEIGDIGQVAFAQVSLGLCYRRNNAVLACSYFAGSILSLHSERDSLIHQDEFNTSLASNCAFVDKFLFQSLLNLNQVKAALLVADSGKAKALNDLTRRDIDVVIDTAPNCKCTFQTISDDPCSETTESLLEDTLPKVINLMEDNRIVSYSFDVRGNLHSWVVSKNGIYHKQWQTANGMSAEVYLSGIVLEVREGLFRDIQGGLDKYPGNAGNDQKIKQNVFELLHVVEKHRQQRTYVRDLVGRMQKLLMTEESRETSNHQRDYSAKKWVKEKYSLDSALPEKKGFCHPTGENYETTQMAVKKISESYSLDVLDGSHRYINRNSNRPSKSPRECTDVDSYLENLYSILVAPIEEHLSGTKVLIVPEGSLLTLPFAALLSPKKNRLCEMYSLQFTPALHVLNFSLTKPLPRLGAALFVGNPTVGNVKFLKEVLSVPPLPNATVEAKECSKYFSAEPVLQENANKENVLKHMKDASIIHIAAHGHMNHADIFLAPNDGAPDPPNEEHYLLTAKDVLNCTLKARLVVLSCCHSGRGQISAEGVVGIARSFLGAGARSVLVTLWKILDKETMEFMKLFYERVCQGLSVCVALQQAMIELKKKYTMPAWAPFQIVGEDIALTQEEIEEIRRQSSLRLLSLENNFIC